MIDPERLMANPLLRAWQMGSWRGCTLYKLEMNVALPDSEILQ